MICKSFTERLVPSTVSKWVSVIQALSKLTPKKYSLQHLDERAVEPSLVARLCSNIPCSNSSMHGALCSYRVRGVLRRMHGLLLFRRGVLGLRYDITLFVRQEGYTRFKP